MTCVGKKFCVESGKGGLCPEFSESCGFCQPKNVDSEK